MIVIQFGIHKSASSFLAQLIEACLIEAEHSVLRKLSTKPDDQFFAEHERFEQTKTKTVILKQHARPKPLARQKVADGKALVIASYRDPRDAALSVLEASEQERKALNNNKIAAIHTLDDAVDLIRKDYTAFFEWAKTERMTCISFDTLATDVETAIGVICRSLNISASSKNVASLFSDKTKIQRFNKGKLDRHKDEMSFEDQARIMKRFDDYSEFVRSQEVSKANTPRWWRSLRDRIGIP